MSLPAGWPAPADVETLPTIWLRMDGSAWPPAQDGRPAGVVPVGDWSVERELVGSTLPGNVRARSGLSVGAASVTIAQMAVRPLAPWATTDDRRVVTGRAADLYATYDGHDAIARIELGDWIVAPAAGGLLNPGVSVDLIERQYEGRRSPHQLPPTPGRVVQGSLTEAAWAVTELAAQMGYHAVPPPVASCILAVPAQGTVTAKRSDALPDVDTLVPAGPGGWDRSTGPLTARQFLQLKYLITNGEWLTASGQSIFLTVNYAGTVDFWSEFATTLGFGISLRPGSGGNRVLAVRVNPGTAGTWATGDFATGADQVHPNRVQVEIQRTGSSSSMGIRARARSSAEAAWSSWVTAPDTTDDRPFNGLMIDTPDTSAADAFSALQVTTEADPALWSVPNADIDPLGVLVGAPWLPAATDAWTGVQEICAATLGAAWITRNKTLMVRDAAYLAGVDRAATPLDVGALAEDISWTVDPADTADRLTVTYQPMTYTPFGGAAPEIWRADNVLRVPAGKTVDIVVDFDGPVDDALNQWIPAWDPAAEIVGCVWSAFTNTNGAGAHASDDALSFTHRWVNSGRLVLSIRNLTGTDLFTVDALGQPCLILRTLYQLNQAESEVIELGLPEVEAVNPMSIDLGRHVQRDEDAQAIADFLWARVSTPAWRADSVRVKLDWTIDMGDVLDLTHARSGLRAKALVSKVAFDGSAGEIAQALDLVLLPPTWSDFDASWAGGTWADFDDAWAAGTWADFDRDPTTTEVF